MTSEFNLSKNPHANPLPAYRDREKKGFTLIELLVVIGIIAILAAFAVPAIYRSLTAGRAMKTKADFQVISTGLEAFKADTGDYPRVPSANAGFAVLAHALVAPYGNGRDDSVQPPNPPVVDPADPPAYSGSKAYEPGDAVRQPPTLDAQTYVALKASAGQAPAVGGNQYWAQFNVNDARDGPGTKVRAGGANQGPYVQQDRFRMRGCALLDGDGNPILYFPASPAKPNINRTNGFVARGDRTVSPAVIPLFDANDNLAFFMSGADTYPGSPTNALAVIQSMLGDFSPRDDNASTNHNGMIDSDKGESAITTGPYILWAPGNDGIYGPINKGAGTFPTKNDLAKCDDVTNFK